MKEKKLIKKIIIMQINVDNKYIKNNESNNCENNIMVYKSENTVKKDNAKTKIKKFFCCL